MSEAWRRARPDRERGVGLVEVLVAFAILMIAVFASSRVQVVAIQGAREASVHFALDRLSNEMIATLRARSLAALAGEFDHELDAAPEIGTGAGALAADWRARTAEAIPGAATRIACADGSCEIVIEWREVIDGTSRPRRFSTGTPL